MSTRQPLILLWLVALALFLPPARAQTNSEPVSFESARRQIEYCLNLRRDTCLAEYFPIATRLAESSSDRATLKALLDRNASRDHVFEDWMDKYCLMFHQISPQVVGLLIKDMEASPYNVDRYFVTPQCQPGGYSNVIQSPLLHIVADDPNARDKFLKTIFAYYSKKRKQPELFTVALNAKNTKGETLLDYIESLRKNGINTTPEQMVVMNQIIDFSCGHGAVYARYANLACQKADQ